MDIQEIWLACGLDPKPALERSLGYNGEAWTLAAESGPVAMGGVCADTHEVWLIGTNWITRNGVAFTKAMKPKLAELVRKYHGLVNYVWDENEVAKRWLRMMGFTVEPPRSYGLHGAPFCYFWIERDKEAA